MKCFDHTDKDDKCTEDQLQHGALNQSGFIAAAGLQKSENTVYKAESTQNRKYIYGVDGISKNNGKDNYDADQCDISAPVKGFFFFISINLSVDFCY